MKKSAKLRESKRVISGVIALLSMISMIFELDLDEGIITELVMQVFGLLSIMSSIYYGITSNRKITL